MCHVPRVTEKTVMTIVDWKPGTAWNTHRTDLETNQRWIERLINLICITLHEPTWTFPWHHPKGIGTTTLQRDLKEHVGQLASLRFYGKWHTYSNWWISAWNGDATFVDNSMMIALAALHINESSRSCALSAFPSSASIRATLDNHWSRGKSATKALG